MKDLNRQFDYNIIAETRDNVNLIILEELGVSEYVQKENNILDSHCAVNSN